MKPDIHPTYHDTQVVCSCGAQFTTRSTARPSSTASVHTASSPSHAPTKTDSGAE